jgi:hypothetical protein
MKEKLYIAYGSNINLEQMAHRCPSSKVVGTAIRNHAALQFQGRWHCNAAWLRIAVQAGCYH